MAEPIIERDAIVGNAIVQAPPAGATAATCRDCDAQLWIDARQVREYGRRPTAVVLCAGCAAPRVPNAEKKLTQVMDAAKKAGEAPDSKLVEMIAQYAMQIEPGDVRTYYEFDPPEAGEAVQETMTETVSGYRWSWVNDLTIPVMVTARGPEGALKRQWVVTANDPLRLSIPKPLIDRVHVGVPPKQKRPVRDNPQA